MVDIAGGGLPYEVTIAPGALDRLGDVVQKVAPGNRCVVIADLTVGELYGHRIAGLVGDPGYVMCVPMSEKAKTRELWASITDDLLQNNYGRDTTLVAFGGGVTGDVAGFVAATYMRGIPYVQVPTSLLAMVDASVGGKTGVDTPHGKNLVGAFHQPAAVLIDPLLLDTLPVEHLRAGFAEIIKHGVVADADYFDEVAGAVTAGVLRGTADPERLTSLIRGSVAIKASVVARDARESGLRKILNFGHTIGHAAEAATNYEMLHGNAVAMGMVAEARIAEHLEIAQAGTAARVESACREALLPVALPDVPIESLISFTRADKKARGGRVEYALPERIGAMAGAESGWAIPVDDDTIRDALAK